MITSPYRGVLLGTALGDALGLPYEGLSPERARRLMPGPLRPRFLLGRAMVSDDTEHTIMVAQSLLRHPEDPDAFARDLAWRLRGWLLGLPAGVGFATLRAALKLLLGFSPRVSGVYSAGNGPAMRSAVIGVCLGADPARLRSFVRAATRLTHTDPRAERGALAIALAARQGPQGIAAALGEDLDPELEAALQGVYQPKSLGVSGYVYDTVPAALSAVARHPGDFRGTLEACVAWGGDTDTVGAIAGALAGAACGEAGLPAEWLERLWEWPRGVAWLRVLADRLEATFVHGERPGPLAMAWPLIPVRNAIFMSAVLAHGVRRLGPPY